MIRLLKKIKNLITRYELIEECKRLERSGRFLPKNFKNLILSQPSRYDDFINILCFIDNNKETNLVDIGANVGEFSKDFKLFFPNTKKIILFEPLSHLNIEIEKNLSGSNFQIFNKAVGNKNEVNVISYKKNETKMASIKEYLDLGKNENIPEGVLLENEVVTEKIETIRLDELKLEKRNQYILKIDVQGFETETLKGAVETLEIFDLIILECSFTHEYKKTDPSFVEAVKILNDKLFYPIVFQGYGNKQSTYAYERDVIFVKKNLLNKIFYKNYNSKVSNIVENSSAEKNIIICAGMKRSGSTLQFNISRMLLESQKNLVNLGEVKRNLLKTTLEEIKHNGNYILKVHDPSYQELQKFLKNKKNRVLYTYRDLRSVYASMKLRSNITLDQFIIDMKEHIKLFDKIKNNEQILIQKYEIFFKNDLSNVEEISKFLKIKDRDDKLYKNVSNNLSKLYKYEKFSFLNFKKLVTISYRMLIRFLPKVLIDYIKNLVPSSNITSPFKKIIHDPITLMDFDHFSPTKGSIDAWKKILTPYEIKKIESEFKDWLKENDYL